MKVYEVLYNYSDLKVNYFKDNEVEVREPL